MKMMEDGPGNIFTDTKWGVRSLAELHGHVESPPLFKRYRLDRKHPEGAVSVKIKKIYD